MSSTPPQTPPPDEAPPASHPDAPAGAPAPDAALQQPSADAEPAALEPAATQPAAAEPTATEPVEAAAESAAGAAEAAEIGPASTEVNRTETMSQSPKLESKRPPPLPSPSPQISQPQQPVSTAAPAPVKNGPPPIIEHVRANFGDVLGPPMEAEVYRRGWVEATVEELHEQLRQHAPAIFQALSSRLATDDLTDAVFNMLGGILRFHHGDQTQNLLAMLHRAYPIDHLFAAMLNPVYLKNLVESLLTSRQPNRQSGQQRGGGGGAGPQLQGESHRGPPASGGAQFNRNGPNPVASPSGATPVHGNGGSFPGTDSPGPQGAPRGQKGASSSPRNATSPTAPNPPVPRSQQIRQQQQQQQMMQPQQPVVNRETDMHQQFHALSQAQAALQRTISGQPAGALNGGRPAALEHEHVGSNSVQSGGAFPTQADGHGAANSNSGSSMFNGQAAQAQPPTPSSTTSSVPFSPLAAAFSAARNPKPAEAPGTKAPAAGPGGKGAMGRGGGVQPGVQATGRGGGQPPANLAEGLQSMLGSGARGGRLRVENGGGMSWADTEESTASSTGAPDLELIGFLRQSNMGQLIEPLGPKTTLAQLRQMGPQEFDATLKRWIASARHRADLKRALHPDNRMPVERQAWLRQQQNPSSGTPPQGPATSQTAVAPGGAAGGLPAPRSKNAPTVGPAAAAAAPPPGGYLPGQTFGVGNAQVMFLRLKLCPHEPDTPQPTDSSFARDAQKQIGVPRAKYLTVTWALGGRGHGSDPIPTVTFTIPKQAAETLRQLEQTTLSIANVLYTVEKCTMGPNLPRNVRLPENHALHSMANSTLTSAPELGGKADHHVPAVTSAGPSSYSAVSAGRVPPTKAAPAPKSPKVRPAGPGTASTTPQQKPPRHADPAAKPTPEHGPARAAHPPAPVHSKGAPMHGGNKRPHDDDERAQLCRFYGGNPGCRRGADCQFRHVTPSNAAASQAAAPAAHHASPARGRGRGPAARPDEADHASQPRGRGRAAGTKADDDATPGRPSHRRSRGGH